MPNEKVLAAKKSVVAELTEKMRNAQSGILVDYKGITVEADTKLRAELRKNGIEYAVVKNTLTRFAAKELGLNELDPLLNGTTALALGMEDPIVPAKHIVDFAKKNPKVFSVKGGFFEGTLDGSFSQICVDDEAMYNEIRSYIRAVDAEKERIVKLYRGTVPIFDNFDISRQIKSLFAKYVSLKRGAYLIMESTEAMHVIDVNSGNRTKAEDNQEQTAMEVNLAAAAEIARQIRLRDWGGLVIVDFIDLHKSQNRQLLYEEMQRLMASDKARHTILPLSKFGLMQITRQRIRPVAVHNTEDICPTCGGTGRVEPTILLDRKIENQISLLTMERGHKYIRLVVSPYVAAFLKRGFLSLRRRWSWRYKARINVVADQGVGMIEVRYEDKEGNDILNVKKAEKSKRRDR